MAEELKQNALHYHRYPKPGKLEIKPTKPLANQRDLALAYSPGVAAACEEIVADPLHAADYTARSNLVGVVTNGTAVLGLGAIGSLAAKPVMEGKAVLFKQFANIDVFDIEIEERDPEKLIETIVRLEHTFGGINLEDIKAPECFVVEEALKKRMKIPIFHDDQHGTAIVVAAGVVNALRVVNKQLGEIRLVASGAGAAALACLDLLVELGLKRENIIVTDRFGVVYPGRSEDMDPYKARFAADTPLRTLEQVLKGADLFLGLSAAGVLKAEWLTEMAERPLIFALANPVPEILPEEGRKVREDAIFATGRSDYPNQINNVLCFPFLFRGALDCGATEINGAMKKACVEAIADIARATPSEIVRHAYGGLDLTFGPDYLIPKPFDPRLMEHVAAAVAEAAMKSGVATRPIGDFEGYRQSLKSHAYQTGMTMKPVFHQARCMLQRVIYTEGDQDKVLQTAQQTIDEGIAYPILIGRQGVIEGKLKALGLPMVPGSDFTLLDPHDNPDQDEHVATYYRRTKRRGVSLDEAKEEVRNNPTALAATMLHMGEVDAMVCGTVGRYMRHFEQIEMVVGHARGVKQLSAMEAVVMQSGTLFFCDTSVQIDPDAEALAEITLLSANEIRKFGIEPKVAMLSHSNFGSHDDCSATKMHQALRIVRRASPELEIEGEMRADLALSDTLRQQRFPDSLLEGDANLLILPNQDAASIACNLVKMVGKGIIVGPILLGAAKSAHIATSSTTVRGLLNLTALAAVQSQHCEQQHNS